MRFLIPCLLVASLLTAGCAGGRKVTYADPGEAETLTVDFGSTDLQIIAGKMVEQMLASAVFNQSDRPVLYFSTVKNKTDEHIDTKNITDKMRVQLIQSGKVALIDRGETEKQVMEEMRYQHQSGMVDPSEAIAGGQQAAPDYFLFGEITSIRKRVGGHEDVYFKFTLNLKNLEKGTLDWAAEKEIRKKANRRLFGS